MPEVQTATTSDDVRSALQELRSEGGLQGYTDAQKEELRLAFRNLAKRSLYFLTKAVLGYPDLRPDVHKPYADFIQDLNKKRTLDLMPRGVYKTTIGTIGFCIWLLINDPNLFIFIANQSARNAQRMLLEIEGHLDGSNPMMNWLFPEMIKPNPRYKPWSSEEMTVPNRNVVSGNPSIVAAGVGAKMESWHFHVVINDDLIGEKAMMSETIMLDAISWHDYSVSLFVKPKDGIERMHGTRWSLADLYSVVMKDPQYHIYRMEARDRTTGRPLFPNILDDETLRTIRDTNFQVYMSQYMNDPKNPEALDFRADWLNYFKLYKDEDKGVYCEMDGEKYFVSDMSVLLFVDPAGSGDIDQKIAKTIARGRATKAENAVVVWGLHGSGNYFLLDMWAGRGVGENPELQVAEQMLKMFMRWKGYVHKGYVENYGAQESLITVFKMLCVQHGQNFPIEGRGRGMQRAKHVRIRGAIGGPAQNGSICVRKTHDKFITQFTEFPQTDLIDVLDASAWAFIMLRRPASDVYMKVHKEQSRRRNMKRLRVISKAGY